MSSPAVRISRSGSAPERRQRYSIIALLALVILLLSACSTNNENFYSQQSATGMLASFEAEDAVVVQSVLTVRDETGASGGRVLVQPDTIQSAGSVRVDAYLTFTVQSPGEHFLWARVNGRSPSEDAVYIGFNGQLERIYPEVHGTYVWLPVTFEYLDAGEQVISLGHGEPEMIVDALIVTDRADLRAEDLERWLITDTLPAMPDPDPKGNEPDEPSAGEEPAPAPQPQPEPRPAPEPQPAPKSPEREGGRMSIRGDANFKPSNLSPEAQIWYRRVWEAIREPDSSYRPEKWASSGDLYTYARPLHTYLQSLLAAFRITGDLALLDEVDKLTELMRDQLEDSWRNTADGSRESDGYLNWVWKQDHDKYHQGKDLNKLDEIKTHSILASVAYALDVNRDLSSPGGRSYGAHADFWEHYLVDHFEAKWRERADVPTAFPFILRPHTHTYHSWLKWHYYMGELTGKSGYSKEAVRMADMLWNNEIVPTPTPSGTGYVWNRSVLSEGGTADYLHPTTYARYVYADIVEFHMAGFHKWASDEAMAKFARTIAEFVIDTGGAKTGTDWFASDIGGGKSRSGIRSDSDWKRLTIYQYESSPYALMMAWDPSDRIDDISERVTDKLGGPNVSRTVYLPVGFLLDRVLN